ncbi:hypothetical protein [Bartonella schoenbuchensis]|nr:hypothetical protein [Bartonella schoenbuchensis]AQX31289.1 hypothetical protein BscR1v2_013810 [Bartonella schoenbuchensis R1]
MISEGSRCLLAVSYGPYTQELGEWQCDDPRGEMIMDLAKTALILDRPVVVTFKDNGKNGKKVKPVLSISLK